MREKERNASQGKTEDAKHERDRVMTRSFNFSEREDSKALTVMNRFNLLLKQLTFFQTVYIILYT